jgi:hypothetical protein
MTTCFSSALACAEMYKITKTIITTRDSIKDNVFSIHRSKMTGRAVKEIWQDSEGLMDGGASPCHLFLRRREGIMSDTLTLPKLTFESVSHSPQTLRRQSLKLGTLTEVEALLDWLEAHGFTEREFVIVGTSEFVVKWR